MSYASTVAALSNIKAHWLFSETSGTSAADAIGSHAGTIQTGTTLNVTTMTGLTPGFSSAGSGYVTFGASADWSMTGDFGVGFMFNSTQSGQRVMIGSVAGLGWIELNAGKVQLWTGAATIGTSGTYNDGTNHYAIITRTGSTVNIYMDGASTATATGTASGTISLGDASNALSAFAFNAAGFAYTGVLDGIFIVKGTALTGSDSSTLYAAAAATASISASPSTILQNSTGNSITVTGSGTSWTAGTPGTPTFTLSGGTGASITAQVVASTTSATLTIDAGSATGTLTITDPSTSTTTNLTVAASATAFTLTGPTSGTVGVASTNFTYTPNNPVAASTTITPSVTTITGTFSTSLTWTAGTNDAKTCTFTATSAGTGSINGTASPSLTQPSSISYVASNPALTAGSLVLASSSPSGPVLTITNGSGGTGSLTHRLHRSTTPAFTASGTTAGSGTCLAVNPSSPYTDGATTAGVSYWYRLITTDAAPTSSSSTDIAGSQWSSVIKLGAIGDSIMANQDLTSTGQFVTALKMTGYTRTVTGSNQGASGSTTAQWQVGQTLYDTAKPVFITFGVTHLIDNLATNDAYSGVSKSTYKANKIAIVNAHFTDQPTLTRVYLPYPTTATELVGGGPAADALLIQYCAALDEIEAADSSRVKVIGRAGYAASAEGTIALSDGVHPSNTGTPTGREQQARLWAKDIALDLDGSAGGGTAVPQIGSSPFIGVAKL